MDLPKLAVGMKFMLDYAISRHRKDHQGLYPKRIELHPQLAPELYDALGPAFYLLNLDPKQYRNVEIVLTERALEPRLITCRNEIDYL